MIYFEKTSPYWSLDELAKGSKILHFSLYLKIRFVRNNCTQLKSINKKVKNINSNIYLLPELSRENIIETKKYTSSPEDYEWICYSEFFFCFFRFIFI